MKLANFTGELAVVDAAIAIATDLRRVPDAPEFSHSMYMVYSSRVEQGLTDLVRYGFRMSTTGPTPAH